MTKCCRCGHRLDPEAGRWDRDATDPDKTRYCVSCWTTGEAEERRKQLAKGPRKVIDDDTRVTYELGEPWENPLGYLRTYGIVGNPWASWMAGRGLLDDYFERPVCAQDFGDSESRQKAEQLGIKIDDRRYAR